MLLGEKETEGRDKNGWIVIVAPHPDDELIGTYEVITKAEKPITIIYSRTTETKRRDEVKKLREYADIKQYIFQETVPLPLVNKSNLFYFPDPYFEIHPLHRYWGAIGESMARAGYDVIFYSTLMNCPYIHEVDEPERKEELLNKVYSSQSDLWRFEKKYVLFEGYCKWVF